VRCRVALWDRVSSRSCGVAWYSEPTTFCLASTPVGRDDAPYDRRPDGRTNQYRDCQGADSETYAQLRGSRAEDPTPSPSAPVRIDPTPTVPRLHTDMPRPRRAASTSTPCCHGVTRPWRPQPLVHPHEACASAISSAR